MASEWQVPTVKCVMCGHEEAGDLVFRAVDVPGNLQWVCNGCGDKFDAACREAAAEQE